MTKIQIIKITDPLSNIETDYVNIDNANESFTSMSKENYEAQQAAQAPQG